MNFNKKIVFYIFLLTIFYAAFSFNPALFADSPDAPAVIKITDSVTVENPPIFSAEMKLPRRVNNLILNSGFEGFDGSRNAFVTAAGNNGSQDWFEFDTDGGLSQYDTISYGYYEGALLRVYRIVDNQVRLVRTSTIGEGGYSCKRWQGISWNGYDRTGGENTHVTDSFHVTNGKPYYYTVQAVDASGNVSEAAVINYSEPAVPLGSYQSKGPRILNIPLRNPGLNSSYSGVIDVIPGTGTPDYTWSINPEGQNALAGIGLYFTQSGSQARISGTVTGDHEVFFTLTLTDSAGLTDSKVFAFNRQNGSPDQTAPLPPSEISIEAGNGCVTVSWEPSPDSDVVEYRIRRSQFHPENFEERVYLEPGEPILPGDLIFFDYDTDNPPQVQYADKMYDTVSPRINNAWLPLETKNVPHPGGSGGDIIPADEWPGKLCLQVEVENDSYRLLQYTTGGRENSWWTTFHWVPGKTYRVQMWLRQDGDDSKNVTFRMGKAGFVGDEWTDKVHEFTGVTNRWQKFTWDFVPSENYLEGDGLIYSSLNFEGPGTYWVDNFMVYCVEDGDLSWGYNKHVLDEWKSILPAGQGSTLRFYDVWNSKCKSNMAKETDFGFMKGSIQDAHHGTAIPHAMSLPGVLQFCYDTANSPEERTIPWITLSISHTEEDWLNLIEYLSGPAGTVYGDKRIAQRGCDTAWTDEFSQIIIEFGNETWDISQAHFATFGDARTYGIFAQYYWDIISGKNPAYESPYWNSKLDNTLSLNLGGWIINNYGGIAKEYCPSARQVGITNYTGGWEAGYTIDHDAPLDDSIYQFNMLFGPLTQFDRIDMHSAWRDEWNSAHPDAPYELLAYEGGPSTFDVPTPFQEYTYLSSPELVAKSLALGAAYLDVVLYGLSRKMGFQNYYALGTGTHWNSHRSESAGFMPAPAWQAIKMRNLYASGDMLMTRLISAPTKEFPEYDLEETPMVSSYAFRSVDNEGNSTYSVFVISRKIDDGTDDLVNNFGNGTTPVTLQLPFTGADKVTLHRLTGDARATNLDSMEIDIESIPLDNTLVSENFKINRLTGGTEDGLPASSIYLYVFEGCARSYVPANPRVSINKAVTQADPFEPGESPEVLFTVLFDRPVTGFGDETGDIFLGGTALPSAYQIEMEPASNNMAYTVKVSGMTGSGSVTAIVAPGAAFSADGSPNFLSTSLDNQVEVIFPPDFPLLEWEFLDLAQLEETDEEGNVIRLLNQDPGVTSLHSMMQPSSLIHGPGTNILTNKHYNNDAYALINTHSPALDEDDYLMWQAAPVEGNLMSLDSVRMGIFFQAAGDNRTELRFSTDGFVTYQDVPLDFSGSYTRTGLAETAGTIVTGDLSGFSQLQNTAQTVEFRLYFYGCANKYVGAGIGKIGKDKTDLAVLGSIRLDSTQTPPQVSINQADDQADPAVCSPGSEVEFEVVFDRAVTGFGDGAGGIILGGTAGAAFYRIQEVSGSGGRVYRVFVSGMSGPGTVTALVRPGAAQGAENGLNNILSTFSDNSITVTQYIPETVSLVRWEFLDSFTGESARDAVTYRAEEILPTALIRGQAFTSGDHNPYYKDDAFSVYSADTDALDEDGYISWQVTPTGESTLFLDSIKLGIFFQIPGENRAELRFSTNGFADYQTVPLDHSGPFTKTGLSLTSGTEVTGDLSGFKELQNNRDTVEFRLYLWGTPGLYNAAGLGKLGSEKADMELFGSIYTGPVQTAPGVTINRAEDQTDFFKAEPGSEVFFTVLFDRCVTGFGDNSDDVIIGGTAAPDYFKVTQIPGTYGTAYTVSVGGMKNDGTVTAEVASGAAHDSEGTGNRLSTSRDNSITVKVYDRALVPLVQWDFPDSNPQDVSGDGVLSTHPQVSCSAMSIGPGAVSGAINSYYQDDAFSITRIDSPELDEDDYISWHIAPEDGALMTIDSLMLGICFQAPGENRAELRFSTDGFVTYQTVTLDQGGPFAQTGLEGWAGNGVTADLSAFTGLTDLEGTVEFRLYLYGIDNKYISAGIGKLGTRETDAVDLEIKGIVR